MTPRQRLIGVLKVLGFTLYKHYPRSDVWGHPGCGGIDDALIGESIATEADLVKHIYEMGKAGGQYELRQAARKLFGI